MRFIIAVFMMINFFFQRYTTTLITLETSYSFSGQIILTVLQDISPSNHLILNVLFSRTKSQFLGEKFSGFAIIALFHILQMYLFAFFLDVMEVQWWWATAHYLYKRNDNTCGIWLIFKKHHSRNLVVSSHTLHWQISHCLLFTSCWLFPSLRFH